MVELDGDSLQSSSRMNHLPEDMENTLTGSQSSHASLRDIHSINPGQLMARIESYEGREKKGISDVRRTFVFLSPLTSYL